MAVDETPRAKPDAGEEGATPVAVRVGSASRVLVGPTGWGANRAVVLPGRVWRPGTRECAGELAGVLGGGELLLGALGGFALRLAGALTSTLALAAGVRVSTFAAGAGADGGPDETPALVVPPAVETDVVALTPPAPAEAETFTFVRVGATPAVAPALAERSLVVGAETVALADAAGVLTDAEAVAPLDRVETETDAEGVCTPASADGS